MFVAEIAYIFALYQFWRWCILKPVQIPLCYRLLEDGKGSPKHVRDLTYKNTV